VSHHLDSPASRRDPRLNVTDVYAFDGDGATVLAMIVNTSLAGDGRIPGFHPEGRYEFKIHLDGAAADDDSAEYQRDTTARPVDDPANDTGRVAAFVAAAARRTGVSDPDGYGREVAARLLPDVLPYRVGTLASFTFAGFNGRALADNAPEVMYGLVTNSAVPTGLVASSASETRQDKFPYVVPA